MKLRVLIADDEPLSRQRLRQLLEASSRVELVVETADGLEALNAIHETSPDLAILDVRMPRLDGFAVVEKLCGARVPVIIFVTAHHEFAVRAFDAHAVDYLLKPFDRARFERALNRAIERLHAIGGGLPDLLHHRALLEKPRTVERLAIKANGKISLVPTAEIDWVGAAGNYVELHVAKSAHLLRMSLTELEQQLPAEQFVRVSRSHLVNPDRIKEIRPKSHGDAVVLLQDGLQLPVSRNYRRHLLRRFSQ